MSIEEVQVISEVPKLPPRDVDGHKGTYGRVLVVAGSRGMSGAAVLSASAALRGGAGLVRLAVPTGIQSIVASANPCYTTFGVSEDSSGRIDIVEEELREAFETNDVLALGPGLGRSDALDSFVSGIVEGTTRPLVLDADGFNALHGCKDKLRIRSAPTIVTPHPGELARFLDTDVASIQQRREEVAVDYAREYGGVLVLKGNKTLVTDGQRLYVNTTGNPGMATGGSGDVLTGILAALLGQKMEMFAAARLGVYLHGLAGDLARDAMGEVSLIATDILEFLPYAFEQLE